MPTLAERRAMMKFPSDPHHLTSFFPKGCDENLFIPHHLTSIFPKGTFPNDLFGAIPHQFSPVSSPALIGVNYLNFKQKHHILTTSPVFPTSLLYITRKKAISIFFLAHSVTLLEKTGEVVRFLLNPLKSLEISPHQLLVRTGETGEVHQKANIGPNSIIRGCWR